MTVTVKCPSGEAVSCIMESAEVLGMDLFEKVEEVTGVPIDMQLLSYGTHLIHPNKKLVDYGLQDNCCIHLSVKGVGGTGDSDTDSNDELLDECVSCGEHATIYCSNCKSSRCTPCNEQWHKHPKRRSHETEVLTQKNARGGDGATGIDEYSMDDQYDDIFNSSSAEDSFQHATLVATLAEKFNLTSFKPFQRTVITAALDGRDTLVIQPTGSGKSLCFQFLPVYLKKKAIIVTPTISLMQDQVHKLNSIGIPSVLLGSAQLDKQVEVHALKPGTKEHLIFVTPEWVTKPANQSRLHFLIQANELSLIAIDEAHLFTEWNDFRSAFSDLRKLKSDFPSVPLMALTATATANLEEDIKLLLRNPIISKNSMNRPNVTLNVEELPQSKSTPPMVCFAKRAAEIIDSTTSIIYTDFIADIGPIVSALQEIGVEAVGYHGEMDAPSRQESYVKWKSGQVQTIVATKAFGMGIDKPDIRHVIRNGVPESMLSWAQELGRAGRDGNQAYATILYHKTDMAHANPWVLNNLSDQERCKRILSSFSESWKYVYAHLAGVCRRRLLLDLFGEQTTDSVATGDCCDVCSQMDTGKIDYKEELENLIDAMNHVGGKGEVKLAEWIRGSNVAWTDAHNKDCPSYENHKGRDINFWRTFIKQCYAASLVKLELKSMIKGSGLYAVNGVYHPSQNGTEAINKSEPVMLPKNANDNGPGDRNSACNSNNVSLEVKKKRLGKGCSVLSLVRRLMSEQENWIKIENKSSYQFPGVLPKPSLQQLCYTENVFNLHQSCDDPHFIWKDVQLSKEQLNKDRLIKIKINDRNEELYYRSAPCLGVKYCPMEGCKHVVPIRDRRNCPKHNIPLQKTSDCPIEFVYLHPKDCKDNRRWIGGIVRCQKSPSSSSHNHPIHAASRITQYVKEKINDAVSANPTLTPSDIACGKGLGFIPSAVDSASSHTGKVSQEIRKTKKRRGLMDPDWSPMNFEEVADAIDIEDNQVGGADDDSRLTIYRQHGRPYLVASGIDEGIKFIFTMSPLMAKVASEADFIQSDITYDDCKEYPYIFNAVAFDNVSMEWMVVARLRLDSQASAGYALSFKKLFDKCRSSNEDFELGSTLQGVVTDWSDAEINGLKMAVGKKTAEKLLKGCKVHWQRSCQRVADKVLSSDDRKREKDIFLKICSQIQTLTSTLSVVACFETLCGVRSVTQLADILPTLCGIDDAKFIDDNCNWSAAKHWAQWWARADYLKMLSKSFSAMEDDIWKRCPSSTNAVERRNKDCKSDTPQCLKLAMMKVYKIDKVACLKHITAKEGVALSYRSRSEEARRNNAISKQKQRSKSINDPDCQYGPPDRATNFSTSSRKRAATDLPSSSSVPKRQAVNIDNSIIKCIPNSHPEIIGKCAKMKFNNERGEEEWYEGMISSYNVITGKFSIYFPSDGQTEEASFDDEDLEIVY